MNMRRNVVDADRFNEQADLPFVLRLKDFEAAMQDVYDFLYDVNRGLTERGLQRFDDMLRPAALSGLLSDMLTACLAKHSRSLVENAFHNGHPDLIVRGTYRNDAVQSGTDGVEIKTTRNAGGAVDTHGARNQWMCVFVYRVDSKTEPAVERQPMTFTKVFLSSVSVDDFRTNQRGALGTKTSTLHGEGVRKLRRNWIYLLDET